MIKKLIYLIRSTKVIFKELDQPHLYKVGRLIKDEDFQGGYKINSYRYKKGRKKFESVAISLVTEIIKL